MANVRELLRRARVERLFAKYCASIRETNRVWTSILRFELDRKVKDKIRRKA